MRSVADTTDFPVICHASDTKDTEYHPKLAGDHFTFGKGILNQSKMQVQVTRQGMVEVDNLLHKSVDALVQYLDEHFRNSLPLFSQLRVFDPVLLPSPDSVSLLGYGKDEIQEIGKICAPDKVAEVVAEFELFKFHMARFNIPAPDKLTGETQ